MGRELVEKIDTLSTGDSVKIFFSGTSPHKPGDIVLNSTLETSVRRVVEQEVDGSQTDEIVKKEIVLNPPAHDDVHEEYVIQTEQPEAGEVKVSPVEARKYFDGDEMYAARQIGFTDITLVDSGDGSSQ